MLKSYPPLHPLHNTAFPLCSLSRHNAPFQSPTLALFEWSRVSEKPTDWVNMADFFRKCDQTCLSNIFLFTRPDFTELKSSGLVAVLTH